MYLGGHLLRGRPRPRRRPRAGRGRRRGDAGGRRLGAAGRGRAARDGDGLAVVMARRRFVSVLLLGGVGQALTVMFLMYGAPDLALTQFMVETMMIVAFVLVLRHLPRDYSAPPSWAPLGLADRARGRGRRHGRVVRAGRRGRRPADGCHRQDRRAVAARGRRERTSSTSRSSTSAGSTRWARSPSSASPRSASPTSSPRPRGAAAAPRPAVRPDRRRVDDLRAGDADDLPHHAARLPVHRCCAATTRPGAGSPAGSSPARRSCSACWPGGAEGRTVVARLSPVVLIAIGMLLAIGTGFDVARRRATSSSRSSIVHVSSR